jgi:hypothetical protein
MVRIVGNRRGIPHGTLVLRSVEIHDLDLHEGSVNEPSDEVFISLRRLKRSALRIQSIP